MGTVCTQVQNQSKEDLSKVIWIKVIWITSEAFKGAVSLISKACAFPLDSLRSIKAPPPMPLDAGLTTPKQRAEATDASTA